MVQGPHNKILIDVGWTGIWPRLFCILMGEQHWARVHGKVWAGLARPPKPSLLLTGPGPAQSLPTPHFYQQGLGRPGLHPLTSIGKPFTFIDGPGPSPSLLLAIPFTSISQTPHFYQPDLVASWPQTQTFPWTAAP